MITWSVFFVPLKIDDTEVPKYTVLLGKFHIHSLGISMGLTLDAWSANTFMTKKKGFIGEY